MTIRRINLGDKVQDVISGGKGIVTGITEWITGCESLTVEQAIKEDGTKLDNLFIDINRAKLIQPAAIEMQEGLNVPPQVPSRVGGPHSHGAPNRNPRG